MRRARDSKDCNGDGRGVGDAPEMASCSDRAPAGGDVFSAAKAPVGCSNQSRSSNDRGGGIGTRTSGRSNHAYHSDTASPGSRDGERPGDVGDKRAEINRRNRRGSRRRQSGRRKANHEASDGQGSDCTDLKEHRDSGGVSVPTMRDAGHPFPTTDEHVTVGSAAVVDTPAEDARRGSVASAASSTGNELCIICAEPVIWYAVGSCNHRTCHICCLRLRALYKTRTCTYCKAEQPAVIFTNLANKNFENYLPEELVRQDQPLNILFDSKEIFDETMVLLRFNCPDPSCDVSCDGGWPEVKKHVREVHKLLICDVCARDKKIFCHEHTLYTRQSLQLHNRGIISKEEVSVPTGFKGHPECGFCKIKFYGDDELYNHCNRKHETCFVCKNMGVPGAIHQYFADYDSLEDHFRNDHFLCNDPQCLAQKFVVFPTDLDLKAHESEVHYILGSSSYRQRSDRRRQLQVQMDFNYAGSAQQYKANRGGSGQRESYVDHRTRHSQPVYQRNRSGDRPDVVDHSPPGGGGGSSSASIAAEGSSSFSLRSRAPAGFGAFNAAGGASTQSEEDLRNAELHRQQQLQAERQRQQDEQWPGLGELIGSTGRNLPVSTPATTAATLVARSQAGHGAYTSSTSTVGEDVWAEVETTQRPTASPATAKQQGDFLARVSSYLKNDSLKLAQFKTHANGYRSRIVAPEQFVESMTRLFAGPMMEDHLGKVVSGMVNLLPNSDGEKGLALLRAWRDKKAALRNEYPDLPASSAAAVAAGRRPAAAPASPGQATAARKVLVIKSRGSTAARSGQSGGRKAWDRVAAAASSTSSLTAAGSSNGRVSPPSPRPPSAPTVMPQWAEDGPPEPRSPGRLSGDRSARKPTSVTQSSLMVRNTEAFPSLPEPSLPTRPAWHGSKSFVNVASAWASGRPREPTNHEDADLALALALSLEDAGASGGSPAGETPGMRKKKNKKQVLMHFG